MLRCECEPDCWCDFFHRSTPVAKKTHCCEECGQEIKPGQRYVRIVGVWDGDFSAHKQCLSCEQIGIAMGCHFYGSMFDDLREWARDAGGDLPLDFFDDLSSDAATLVEDRVLEWLAN
ncbi:MAG: hypothetical protein PHV85_00210 [Desulfovibrionaceae bacterium]|nr:hypothetical protein [Desulfovibrionaceae bacterium]